MQGKWRSAPDLDEIHDIIGTRDQVLAAIRIQKWRLQVTRSHRAASSACLHIDIPCTDPAAGPSSHHEQIGAACVVSLRVSAGGFCAVSVQVTSERKRMAALTPVAEGTTGTPDTTSAAEMVPEIVAGVPDASDGTVVGPAAAAPSSSAAGPEGAGRGTYRSAPEVAELLRSHEVVGTREQVLAAITIQRWRRRASAEEEEARLARAAMEARAVVLEEARAVAEAVAEAVGGEAAAACVWNSASATLSVLNAVSLPSSSFSMDSASWPHT